MRLVFGFVVLALAGVWLGWLQYTCYGPHIQMTIATRAAAALGDTVHPVALHVSGRDIYVSGLADGPAERGRILAALDGVEGRRRVVDALEVLPLIEPFSLELSQTRGAIAGEGYVPTQADAERLSSLGTLSLTLAAGAPAGWAEAVTATVAALTPLESGRALLEGQTLTLIGIARTPVEGRAVQDALATLPAGYGIDNRISYIDDGTPAAYQLSYRADRGVWVEGKLPRGVTAGMIAQALNLPRVEDAATTALVGDAGQPDPALGVLADWMADVEGFTLYVDPEGSRAEVLVPQGADLAVLEEALGADLSVLGTALSLVATETDGQDGDMRVNVITGQSEALWGGFWLPVPSFDPAPETCSAETRAALQSYRIGFLSGSAQLDARAQRSVNVLASVMRACIQTLGLGAEVGGHTDNTGTDEANLILSQARAEAVKAALIARGVPADALSARGYGAAEPVADNETEEGRAANRRTAITWSGA